MWSLFSEKDYDIVAIAFINDFVGNHNTVNVSLLEGLVVQLLQPWS